MKTLKRRLMAIVLSLAMVLTLVPALGVTAVQADEMMSAFVLMTVSIRGELARANDGTRMVRKKVIVSDLDGNGELSYDEALIAAHDQYHGGEGYAVDYGTNDISITWLWGEGSSNVFCFRNDELIQNDVVTDTVWSGDILTVSVNQDDVYSSDYFTYFSPFAEQLEVGQPFPVNLWGYMGMGNIQEAQTIPGAILGYYTAEGDYVPLDVVTDEYGGATVSFSEPGTYYLTAFGSVAGSVVTDKNLMNAHDLSYNVDGSPFCKIVDWDTLESYIAYTENDYGDGPYPADEIQYTDLFEYDANTFEYFACRSNQVIVSAPIIAPCCVVEVVSPYGSGAYPSMQGGSGAYPGMQGGSGAYPSMQGGSGAYPSMQGGSEIYPSMQGYSSMQSGADVYPSAQNGVDLSGAVYAVVPVVKTIDDATASSVSNVETKDLHFIQEWDITSDTYPLNVTFYVAGAERMTLYVISDSDDGWTRVDKRISSSLTVTFTHDTHAAVYVGPSLLTSFQIEDLEIVENTHGWMTSEYDPVTGTYQDFFRYYLENDTPIQVSIVYDGETYTGSWSSIASTLYSLTGIWPSQGLVYYQYYDSRWITGNSYEVTGYLMGMSDTFEVTIKESPLTSIEIENLEIMENTCGYQLQGYDPITDTYQTYYYYYPQDSQQLRMTIEYDNQTYSGSWSEIQNILYELTGTWTGMSVDGNGSQYDYQTRWIAGNTYAVTGTLMGISDTFEVTIKKSPLTSIRIENLDIIENTCGYWNTDYNYETGDYDLKYFYYNPNESKQLQLTIEYDNQVYSGSWNEISSMLSDFVGTWVNLDVQGSTYQSYENRWTLGNTYTVTGTLLGLSTDFEITIVPSPLTNFHIDDMEFLAGTNGYWSTDRYGQRCYMYEPMNSGSLKASYVYEGESYTANSVSDLPGLSGEWINIDSYSSQSENPWVPGQTYPVTASLLGTTCTFNITIVPNKLSYIGIDDIHILEHTNGGEVTEMHPGGGSSSFFQYSPTSQNIFSIKIIYDNETFVGSENEIMQFLAEKLGTRYSLYYNWNLTQSSNNPWTAGNTYRVTSYLLDKACTYNVTIDKAAKAKSIHADNGTDFVLYKGYYYSYNLVSVSYEPDNADIATEWTTDDSSIVAINSGMDYLHPYINPVGVGQTTITARSKSNPDLAVTFNVTVVDEDAPIGSYTTDVTIGKRVNGMPGELEDPIYNPTYYNVKTGETFDLNASIKSIICVPNFNDLYHQFSDLQFFEITDGGCGGGMGNFGASFTYKAIASGTETMKIGNNYELVLEAGDYEITFVDENGNVLQKRYVAADTMPVYAGDTPTKAANEQYSYTFAGWTPEIQPATEDTTYTATYNATVNNYSVTFVNEDGTVLKTAAYPYGTAAEDIVLPDTPMKAADDQYSYAFYKWTPEITDVTGDATYTATYRRILEVEDVTISADEGFMFDYEYDMNLSVAIEVQNEDLLDYVYTDKVDGFTTNLISFESEAYGAGESWIYLVDTDKNEILKAYHLEILPCEQEIYVCKDQYIWDATGYCAASSLTPEDSNGVNVIWRNTESRETSWGIDAPSGHTMFIHTYAVYGKEAGDYVVNFYNGDLLYRTVTYHVIEGHQYKLTSSTVTVEPTCTEKGEEQKVYTCEICGAAYTLTEELQAKGHHYDDWTVIKEATCTEDGSRAMYCTVCGEMKEGSEEVIEKYGHAYETVEGSAIAATCTTDGKEADQKCSRCGDLIQGEVIPKFGHAYEIVEGTAIEVTCTTDGREADQKCSRCGDLIEGAVIPKLGHIYKTVEGTAIEATCTTAGREADLKCDRCGNLIEGAVIPKLGHAYEPVEGSAIEPTCTTGGKEPDHKCERCGNVIRGTVLGMLGHAYETVEGSAVAATCTTNGKEADQKCANCGDIIEGTVLPKFGHDWSQWTVTKSASTTEEGEEVRKCGRCGEEEKRILPIIEQEYNDVQNENAWYYDTVYKISSTENENGKALMSGYASGNNFGPADPLTRQDFAVILYRLADEPDVADMPNPFTDTKPGAYYYTSVLWAKANNVIAGYNDGRFGVGDKITREQVATILYRFAKDYMKINTDAAYAKGDLSKFSDGTAISSWAEEALTWATGAGLITGKDNGTRIDARGNAVRAEIGAMVLRFIDYMNDAQ